MNTHTHTLSQAHSQTHTHTLSHRHSQTHTHTHTSILIHTLPSAHPAAGSSSSLAWKPGSGSGPGLGSFGLFPCLLPFCCFFDLTVPQADFSFSFSFLLHTSDQELVVFLPQEKILSESTLFLYSFLTLLQWGEWSRGWNLVTPDWPPVGAAQGPPTTSDGAVDQHRQDTWVHLKGQRLTAFTDPMDLV